jgi:hypothetical protein
MAIDTESWRAISVSVTMRSRKTASDAAARVNVIARPRTSGPQRIRRDRCSPAARSGDLPRERWYRLFQRFHHPFADPAAGVDHPPQADVVVRVDDEPHVASVLISLRS